MESQSLKVLAIPLGSTGHVNPMLSLATTLKNRNHEVIFAMEKEWERKLVSLGFKVVILLKDGPNEVTDQKVDKNPLEQWVSFVEDVASSFGTDPYDLILKNASAFQNMMDKMKRTNTHLGQVIKDIKPDIPGPAKRTGETPGPPLSQLILSEAAVDSAAPLVSQPVESAAALVSHQFFLPDPVLLYDQHVWHPAILTSGVPFVHFIPANPLPVLQGDNLIPSYFGLPLDSSPEVVVKYKKRKAEAFESTWNEYVNYVKSSGAPLPQTGMFRYFSANLNIYLYPQKLAQGYLERSTNGTNWIGIDYAFRPVDNQYLIPETFKALPGKTVFLSMGTLGSMYVELMKRLVNMLSVSSPKYKFIVSKGAFGEKYELAENMIGESYVPQLGVLPQVDLAIIHGGNNTFTEAIYFGKPMIVIPLFTDQADNAQRAVDARIGARFNPFTQSGEELIDLMDKVLNDVEILKNVQEMSKASRESQSIEKAVDSIESVARNPKYPTYV